MSDLSLDVTLGRTHPRSPSVVEVRTEDYAVCVCVCVAVEEENKNAATPYILYIHDNQSCSSPLYFGLVILFVKYLWCREFGMPFLWCLYSIL